MRKSANQDLTCEFHNYAQQSNLIGLNIKLLLFYHDTIYIRMY